MIVWRVVVLLLEGFKWGEVEMDKSSGMFRHCSIFSAPVTANPRPGLASSLQRPKGSLKDC